MRATENEVKQVTLRWQRSSATNVVAYRLEASPVSPIQFRLLHQVEGITEEETYVYRHDGLDDGAAFAYRVRAVDADGLLSPWSDLVHGRARPLPAPPQDVAVSYATGTATLRWSHPSVATIQLFTIWRKGLFGWKQVGTTRDEAYVLTREDIGRNGRFAVSALDEKTLESERSTEVEVHGGRLK